MKRKPITDEGQKNQGGASSLDVSVTNINDLGITIPYAGFRIMSPVYIQVDRDLTYRDLRGAVAHNFMHCAAVYLPAPG